MRNDPFLPFLDLSYKRGGQDVLKNTFQCVTPNAQGTLTAHFGYTNANGVVVTIPYGTKNSAPRDTFGTRPTAFFPGGAHNFAAAIDFPSGQSAVWTLSPDNNPTTTLTATASSPRCTAAQSPRPRRPSPAARFAVPAARRSNTYAQCSEGTAQLNQLVAEFLPQCVPAQTAFMNCIANTPPGPAWDCNAQLPTACFDEADAYFACLG